ncbi:hypothetical protein ABZ208_14005 [Streptomyces sp. NPDC006208]
MTANAPFLNAPLLALLHLTIAVLQQRAAAADRAIARELAWQYLAEAGAR